VEFLGLESPVNLLGLDIPQLFLVDLLHLAELAFSLYLLRVLQVQLVETSFGQFAFMVLQSLVRCFDLGPDLLCLHLYFIDFFMMDRLLNLELLLLCGLLLEHLLLLLLPFEFVHLLLGLHFLLFGVLQLLLEHSLLLLGVGLQSILDKLLFLLELRLLLGFLLFFLLLEFLFHIRHPLLSLKQLLLLILQKLFLPRLLQVELLPTSIFLLFSISFLL